ncbi:hypothetical protein [Psychrobacillus sp. L3]|uniref:hypothetical protein n=1 Tax=Psychrobacillus sp. L3 TaxID=3236891 RepID=UPI0036F1CDD4
MATIEHLSVTEETNQECKERSEVLPRVDKYHILLTNEVDEGTSLYTTTEPHIAKYEMVKQMLDEFAENE